MSSGLIECRFCGKKLKVLNSQHLKSHGLTMLEYRKLFPDQKEFVSEETRKRIGDSERGVAQPRTAEHSRKIGLSQRGKVIPQETRQKMSDSLKGRSRPDLQGDNHPFRRNPEWAKKMGRTKKGVPCPKICGDNNPMRKDPELPKRVGDSLRGKPNWTSLPENAEKWALAREKATKTARKGSSIERALHWVLDELNLTWRKRTLPQVTKKGVVHVFDAVVEACNVEEESFSLLLALECDGCYWHGCEKCRPGAYEYEWVRNVIERDRLIDQTCHELGIPILRFWEHDMKNLPYVMGMIVHTLGALQTRKIEMLKAKAEETKVLADGNSN